MLESWGKSFTFFILLFGISLFSYNIGSSPILICDLALIAMILWSIIVVRKFFIAPAIIITFFWLIIALVGGLVAKSAPYYNPSTFNAAFMRALLGVLCLVFVIPLMNRMRFEKIRQLLLIVLRTHAVVLIIQVILNVITGRLIELFRSSGLFREPAWFGWFIALGLFAVLSISKITHQKPLCWWDFLLFFVSAILSTSLVSIVLISLALLIALFINITFSKYKLRFRMIILSLTVVIIIFGAIILNLSSTPKFIPLVYLYNRIPLVLGGRDASTADRIFGTLEMFAIVMNEAPLMGIGIGNEEPMAQYMRSRLKYLGSTHIGLLTVFISTGLLGGLFYLIMILPLLLCPTTRLLGFGFILSQLGFGGYRLGPFWFFLALGITLISRTQMVSKSPII